MGIRSGQSRACKHQDNRNKFFGFKMVEVGIYRHVDGRNWGLLPSDWFVYFRMAENGACRLLDGSVRNLQALGWQKPEFVSFGMAGRNRDF